MTAPISLRILRYDLARSQEAKPGRNWPAMAATRQQATLRSIEKFQLSATMIGPKSAHSRSNVCSPGRLQIAAAKAFEGIFACKNHLWQGRLDFSFAANQSNICHCSTVIRLANRGLRLRALPMLATNHQARSDARMNPHRCLIYIQPQNWGSSTWRSVHSIFLRRGQKKVVNDHIFARTKT